MSPTWFPASSKSKPEQTKSLVLLPNQRSNAHHLHSVLLAKKQAAVWKYLQGINESNAGRQKLLSAIWNIVYYVCPPVYLCAVRAEIFQSQRQFVSYLLLKFPAVFCFSHSRLHVPHLGPCPILISINILLPVFTLN